MKLVTQIGLVLLLFSIVYVESKKKDYSQWVQKVETVKDFKKILRTKINVLAIFATSDSAADSLMSVFGEAAIASKGSATLIQIDCSTKEGKKLCKKQKVKPDPTLVQHFKDGEFSSTYERKFTVKSILAFLRDPTSDGPWEEEDIAQDVMHLHTENDIVKLLKKKKPTLLMFYAPWCGYCKRFKPTFAEAATEMKGKVIFAGIDADSNEASGVRQSYNITGFPKTVYFENGKQKFEYSGGHKKEEVIDWLNDPQPPKEKEPEVAWDETENDVIHLTDTNFDEFIAENSKVLVFFYAPWCGHCKNLKPEWDKAATTLKEEEAPEKLTAMDATKFSDIANRYKVKGYPTVIYFENGEEKFDASSAFKRDAEGIVEYIKNPKEPPPPEKEWSEIESDVQHLTDETFKPSTKKKKHTLVMFYAPWCGHCKNAKPEFTNAASSFASDKKVMFVAVDCTKQPKTCQQYSVQGYPTFYYLSYGKNEVKYQGGREELDFVKYMEKIVDESSEDDIEREETFWEDITNSALLHQLTEYSWINFVRENPSALIVIYDVNCPNCKAIRSEISECAHLLLTNKVPGAIGVTRIDMFNQQRVEHLWEQSMGVPTLLWFESGNKQFEYTGTRTGEALFDFMKNPEKHRPVIDRDWSMEFSSENVYHLDDSTFHTFVNDGDDVLVFLYTPTCSSCNNIKHEYEEAATILDEVKYEASLAAVNVLKAPGVKLKHDVDSLPAFLYFKDGNFKYQYYGNTTAENFIDFMLKPAFIEKPTMADEWKSNKNIIRLDEKTINLYIEENDNMMILFYAPWCGHCKKFKPAYFKAADILTEQSTSAKLAVINADKSKALNSKYDVKGFPTLVYFRNHKFVSHYNEERSTDKLVDFMLNSGEPSHNTKRPVGTGKTDEVDIINGTRPNEVSYLDPDNFDEFISSHENVMIMFYAPWCGACKNAKSSFFNAAVEIEEDSPETSLAIFNADKYRSYVDSFDIKGYPTFWIFRDGEKLFKYHGSNTAEAITEFIANPFEEPEPESTADDVMWISEKSDVRHLSRENFEKFLEHHKSVMVFFYIHACEFCLKTLKPKYVEAASILSREHWNAKLTAINAEWEKPIASKFSVNAFPTLLYFRDGKLKYKYQGPTDTTSIIKFMKNPTEELARKKKPVSWQDMSSEEYGRVEHLSNKTYDSFIDRYENAIVMFHSAYYSRCLSPRSQFREAGDRLPKEIGLGAVDCHRKPEQGIICYNMKIKKYPAFKYYQRGQFISEFDGATADDFVTYLEEHARQSERDEL